MVVLQESVSCLINMHALTTKCKTNLRNYLRNNLEENYLRNYSQDMLVNNIEIKISSRIFVICMNR